MTAVEGSVSRSIIRQKKEHIVTEFFRTLPVHPNIRIKKYLVTSSSQYFYKAHQVDWIDIQFMGFPLNSPKGLPGKKNLIEGYPSVGSYSDFIFWPGHDAQSGQAPISKFGDNDGSSFWVLAGPCRLSIKNAISGSQRREVLITAYFMDSKQGGGQHFSGPPYREAAEQYEEESIYNIRVVGFQNVCSPGPGTETHEVSANPQGEGEPENDDSHQRLEQKDVHKKESA